MLLSGFRNRSWEPAIKIDGSETLVIVYSIFSLSLQEKEGENEEK
jgi:hypothetical protein